MSWKQISEAILRERETIIEGWLKGPDGKDLLRLERAYVSLTGQVPPTISEIAARLDHESGFASYGRSNPFGEAEQKRSVKEAVADLMSKNARPWTIGEIFDVLRDSGEAFQVQDLRGSIRSALFHLTSIDFVRKSPSGEYQYIKQDSHAATDGSLPSGGDGEASGEGWGNTPPAALAESQSVR